MRIWTACTDCLHKSIQSRESTNKILCWNCCGASSGHFFREIKELRRVYKPVLIISLEPKVSGKVVDKVCKSLGMSR